MVAVEGVDGVDVVAVEGVNEVDVVAVEGWMEWMWWL